MAGEVLVGDQVHVQRRFVACSGTCAPRRRGSRPTGRGSGDGRGDERAGLPLELRAATGRRCACGCRAPSRTRWRCSRRRRRAGRTGRSRASSCPCAGRRPCRASATGRAARPTSTPCSSTFTLRARTRPSANTVRRSMRPSPSVSSSTTMRPIGLVLTGGGDVGHEARHLDDPQAAVRLPVDGDRILHERFAGDQFEPVARREMEGGALLVGCQGGRLGRHGCTPGGHGRRGASCWPRVVTAAAACEQRGGDGGIGTQWRACSIGVRKSARAGLTWVF